MCVRVRAFVCLFVCSVDVSLVRDLCRVLAQGVVKRTLMGEIDIGGKMEREGSDPATSQTEKKSASLFFMFVACVAPSAEGLGTWLEV